MKTLAILLTLLLCVTAQARLGETPAECVARYGDPIKTDKEAMTIGFQKEGIFIMCVFHEGKCASIAFKKPEGDFSETEIVTLREANGSDWKESPSAVGQKHWENGRALVVHEQHEGLLIIITQEERKRRDAAKAAAEKEKLKDF